MARFFALVAVCLALTIVAVSVRPPLHDVLLLAVVALLVVIFVKAQEEPRG